MTSAHTSAQTSAAVMAPAARLAADGGSAAAPVQATARNAGEQVTMGPRSVAVLRAASR
jgi:hypothetical protein